MTQQVRRCPDCGMAMTFGYLTSRRPGVRFHEHGELLGDPWGDRITSGLRHRVDAHRCTGCGLVIVPRTGTR